VLAQRYQCLGRVFGTGPLFTEQPAKAMINLDLGSPRSGYAGAFADLLGNGKSAQYELGADGHCKRLEARVKSTD